MVTCPWVTVAVAVLSVNPLALAVSVYAPGGSARVQSPVPVLVAVRVTGPAAVTLASPAGTFVATATTLPPSRPMPPLPAVTVANTSSLPSPQVLLRCAVPPQMFPPAASGVSSAPRSSSSFVAPTSPFSPGTADHSSATPAIRATPFRLISHRNP